VREQSDFLNYITDASPEMDRIPVPDALAFDEQVAGRVIPQAVDQLQHGSLAATAAAQQCYCFPLMNF